MTILAQYIHTNIYGIIILYLISFRQPPIMGNHISWARALVWLHIARQLFYQKLVWVGALGGELLNIAVQTFVY